jgi:uncharacterized protein involved in exopolysaccharide biosynthesis
VSPNSLEAPSVFSLVRREWKLAAGVAILVVGASAIYTAVIPAVWEAKTTLIFPTRMPSILGSQGFAEQTSLAATLTGQATPLKVYKGILESERALGFVSEKTGIKKRKIMEDRDIVDTTMQSTITLTYRSRDPKLAQQVVQFHLDALSAINAEVSSPLFFDDVAVLEREVKKQERKVLDTEARLLSFQQAALTAPSVTQTGTGRDSTLVSTAGNWMVSLRQLEIERTRISTAIKTAQARTNSLAIKDLPSDLPPVRRWRQRLAEMEYELRMVEQVQPETSPEVTKLKERIELTKGQFGKELRNYVRAINAGAIDPTSPESAASSIILLTVVEAQIGAVKRLAKLAPAESVKLSRLMREVSLNSIILQQLQSQYQLALLQKARDPNRWEVLDTPEVADKPVNKSYSKNGAMGALLGIFLGCLLAALKGERDRTRGAKPVLVSVEEGESSPEELKQAQ